MLNVFMVYEVNPPTWFYLSLLMVVGIFFKFRRVWSIRNLDLLVLSLLSPGLLLISYGYCSVGYPCVLAVSFLLMFRMLCDPLMVRRPLLDVNLSRGGMVFSCVALTVFLIASTFLTNWRNPVTPQMANMQQLVTRQLNERILEYMQKQNEQALVGLGNKQELKPATTAEGSKAENAGTLESTGSAETLVVPDPRGTQDPTDKKTPQVLALPTHGPGLPFFTTFADQSRQFLFEELRRERLLELSASGSEGTAGTVGGLSGFVAEMNGSRAPGNQNGTAGTLSQNTTNSPLSSGQGANSVKVGSEFPLINPQNQAVHERLPLRAYWATQLLVIFSQLAILWGIIMVGWIHFENFNTGVAAATLYLLLPYSSQMPTQLEHIVPAALIIWAIFSYRIPALSGVLIGIAAALVFYPVALIPLWCAFYWSRGRNWFLATSLSCMAALILLAIPLAGGLDAFTTQLQGMFGVATHFQQDLWNWDAHCMMLRMPVIVVYAMMVVALAFWPAQKNLGTLLSSSAALMVGVQFCLPFQGGLYMAWFLPLMILVVMRPNLEDRIAIRAISSKRPAFSKTTSIP